MFHFVVAALIAAAADTAPPKIVHAQLDRAPRGQNISIEATITDPSGVFQPLVFARGAGQRAFASYPMDERENDKYVADLPQAILSKGFFEYFIEASDNQGNTATVGSQKSPFKVTGFDPAPKPVRISVRTEPEGADLFVDGAPEGKAPRVLQLTPGSHIVAVSAEGRRGSERQFELTPGRDLDLFIALAEAKGTGSLTILSEPQGARILVDGQRVGTTPYKGPLIPGTHRITLEMEGHLRPERDVTLAEGRDVELSFPLPEVPKEPALTVDTEPSGAALAIDGKDRGRSPYVGPLGPGPHQVVVRMDGRREVATDFVMPRGRDLSLRLDLPAAQPNEPPHLTVTSQPEGGHLFLDGAEIALTPWQGDIAEGVHQLKVVLDNFEPQEKKVTVAKNRDAEVSFALVRKPGPARVRVESEPLGATISIDGKPVGPAPYTGELQPGEHQVEAHRPGFRGAAQQIAVEAGQHLSLKLALAAASKTPEPPQLQVLTQPQGAKLTLDGQPVGTAPFKQRATPGAHVLKMELEGYQPRDAKFNFPEGRDVELVLAVSLKALREGSSVEGPDARALARAQVKRAQACFQQGDYDCALAGFKAAYEYKAVPELLFNIAQARRKKGEHQEAAAAYRAFLRDAPDHALAAEARRWAAFSEGTAAGKQVVAQEEDKSAPTLTHAVLTSATRNKPLKIAARIKDDRSGVFSPQACWRNLYAAEYECAAMVLVGADEYAAEVPARAVVDGFAYFLEAYDNSGNGPARSGAAELPNSVAMVETAKEKPVAPGAAVEPQTKIVYVPVDNHFLSRTAPRLLLGLSAAAGATGGYFAWQYKNIADRDTTTPTASGLVHSISQPDAKRANNYAQYANTAFIATGVCLLLSSVLAVSF